MLYTFHHRDAVLEFAGNRGSVLILASSGADALERAQAVFGYMRDTTVSPRLSGEFLVQFKVRLNYRLPLLKSIESALKRLSSYELYSQARYLDRYIVALISQLTGEPKYLASLNLDEELGALRSNAVIAREVSTAMRFVDWDIAIYNFIELNTRTGHTTSVRRSTASHAKRADRV